MPNRSGMTWRYLEHETCMCWRPNHGNEWLMFIVEGKWNFPDSLMREALDKDGTTFVLGTSHALARGDQDLGNGRF